MAYFCTATDVMSRISSQGYALRLDDRPGAINQVLQEATNFFLLYALSLYSRENLQANADADGFVNDVTTTLAVCILCRRRGNTIPGSLEAACKEAKQILVEIKEESLQIPEVEMRNSSFPVFSNVRVDQRFTYKQTRVEYTISDPTTPVGYTQTFDWRSLMFLEY